MATRREGVRGAEHRGATTQGLLMGQCPIELKGRAGSTSLLGGGGAMERRTVESKGIVIKNN